MSIRFAPASRGSSSPLARTLKTRRGLVPANDNSGTFGGEKLLGEALRHFAVHGLAAAEAAVDAAADAAARGDAEAQDHWLALTRMFDRRLAARAGRELIPA